MTTCHGHDVLEADAHNLKPFGRDHGMFGQKAKVLEHSKDVDVVVAKAHPEPDIGLGVVGGQRMHLVVARHIGLLLAHDGQVPFAANLEHLVLFPRAALPAVDRAGKLAKVDLGVEVGREILAVITRINIDDVD